MTFTSGVRLGSYEIVSPIGAGGMGEVYKARDTRLDRTVAIKVLSAQLAADPEFRSRFEREGRSVSHLNHPNICTLHDIGQADGPGSGTTHFLVLEYLDGETLTHRLARGPLSIAETLRIGAQLAAALDAAHRQRLVHRDLKPGNIMLTRSGAKLLDFGLAKATPPALALTAADPLQPTELATLTDKGTVLGTVQNMAPEQVEGRDVDARTDIFALGTVLYQMLTSRPAFQGNSAASMIGAILRDEPTPIGQLRPDVPTALDQLVRTCLAKDPDDRVQSAHDVGLQLQWIAQPSGVMSAPERARPARWRVALSWAPTAATVILAAALIWSLTRPPDDDPLGSRFLYALPANQQYSGIPRHVVALSPDGKKLAYTADRQIFLRPLDQLEGQPLRGTADGAVPVEPVFSPDGQWLAYFAIQRGPVTGATQQPFSIMRVAVTGGAPVKLGQLNGPPFGASWHRGLIVVGRVGEGIQAIPEAGGPARTLITVDPVKERAVQPQLLDDGRHVLFAVTSVLNVGRETANGEGQIVVQAIDGGPRKVLVNLGANPRLLPTGHLVYVHDHTLFAVAFDSRQLAVTGTPMPIEERIEQAGASAAAQFAVSNSGVLAYLPVGFSSTARQLLLVDRQGREEVLPAPPGAYQQPRLSPDGKRMVVSANANLSVWSFASRTLMRLTNENATQYNPAWTPDGRAIFYDSNDGSGASIMRRAADGTGTATVVAPAPAGFPEIVTADGKSLIYHNADRVAFVLPLDPPGVPRPLFSDVTGQVSDAEISSDGKWIAYESNESGRFEINVRAFPNVKDGRQQVSAAGGLHPRWSADGSELFYIAGDGTMMSVPVESGSTLVLGRPVPLFNAGQYHVNVARNYDVTADGKRFVMVRNAAQSPRTSMIVVTRWFEELRAKIAPQR